MSEFIVVTPDGEEVVICDYISVTDGCLFLHRSFSSIGPHGGYNQEEWKSYRIKDKA